MKTIFRKHLILFAVFLGIAACTFSSSASTYAYVSNNQATSESGKQSLQDQSLQNVQNIRNDAQSILPTNEDVSTGANCRPFLGLTSWDCNTLPWEGENNLKANILIIAFNVLTDISVLAAYLVVGFVIYGGYQYIMASGDPGKVAQGKKTIIHAFIGLGIVLLSNIILNTIRVVTMGENGSFANCANQECVNDSTFVVGIINWVIGISGLVALIFIFIGGIGYLTSAGDPNKLKKAKDTILYAAVGLGIVALAFGATAFVTNLINGSKTAPESNQTSYVISTDKKELL